MATLNRSITALVLFASVWALQAPVMAETVVVQPQNEYAQIDTRSDLAAIATLAQGTIAEFATVVAQGKRHPERYAPPVLYALSDALFRDGQKDDGAFWFYAGQLRARFDANRCADVSARQAVAVLNQHYETQINQHTFQDIPKLKALVARVVEWDEATPHRYDHRWINLRGMQAMLPGTADAPGAKALSLPQAQWESIAHTTRQDYVNGFQKALDNLPRPKP